MLLDRSIGQQQEPKGVGPWKAICNVWKLNDQVEQVCRSGIRIGVGNGETTLIWEDLWIGNETLASKFPRLYSLSEQKHMKIIDCGL